MGFFKNQDAWLSRGGVAALVVGTFFLLKFVMDSQPHMEPANLIITEFPEHSGGCQADCHSTPLVKVTDNVSLSTDPNSYLPCKDYVRPGSSTHKLNVSKYFQVSMEDSELLHAAQDAATQPLAPGKPRVAFLFVLRQEIPLEPVWERFFAGADKAAYSIYTHPSWWINDHPNTSIFYNTAISTKKVARFSISLVDVVRRLLAFALLDNTKANMWFAFVSEACIPVRSFPYVYNYFMNSTTSFVEAYSPIPRFKRWDPLPVFKKEQLRKGELWISIHRRHAGMLVGDVTFYRKFKADCRDDCTFDEEYSQTLLSVLDPTGIANRSVTYCDWSNPKHGGSPGQFLAQNITASLFQKIQNRTENLDGQYMDSSDDSNLAMQTCIYNGQPNSPCFLFARKFAGEKEVVDAITALSAVELGY